MQIVALLLSSASFLYAAVTAGSGDDGLVADATYANRVEDVDDVEEARWQESQEEAALAEGLLAAEVDDNLSSKTTVGQQQEQNFNEAPVAAEMIAVMTAEGQRVLTDKTLARLSPQLGIAALENNDENTGYMHLAQVTAEDMRWINRWYAAYQSADSQYQITSFIQELYDDPAPYYSALISLTKAVHYLDIKPLYNRLTKAFADLIRDKSYGEIRQIFYFDHSNAE